MKKLLFCLALATLLACSDDEAATTANNASTNNMTTNNGVRDQQTIPELPDVCDGCYDDGVCHPGNERIACGSAGAACLMCGENENCESGACVPKRTCGPDTCTGCCTADDQCVTGSEALACGRAGTACEACSDGTACIDQRCQGSCGPDNCAGCCDANGVCVTNGTDTACGMGGGFCQNCAINGGTCGGAACVNPACSQTCDGCCNGDTCVMATSDAQCGSLGDACVACPGDQRCSRGTCVANTNTMADTWDIVLIGGEVDFWDYDFSSAPDPYLDVYFSDPATQEVYYYETWERYDTYSPQWNETIEGVPTDYVLNGFVFEMWDYDSFDDDEICTMTAIPTMADLGGPIITTVCPEYPDIKVFWQIVPSP